MVFILVLVFLVLVVNVNIHELMRGWLVVFLLFLVFILVFMVLVSELMRGWLLVFLLFLVFVFLVFILVFLVLVMKVNSRELMRGWLLVFLLLVRVATTFEEREAVPGHFGYESVVFIGGVVYLSSGSIGLLEFVVTLHLVAIPRLLLTFDVVSVGVVDAVHELVVRMRILCMMN